VGDPLQVKKTNLAMPGTGARKASRRRKATAASDVDYAVMNWEVYEGNNLFCCDGRVITGPERGSVCCTATLIIMPKIVFFTIM